MNLKELEELTCRECKKTLKELQKKQIRSYLLTRNGESYYLCEDHVEKNYGEHCGYIKPEQEILIKCSFCEKDSIGCYQNFSDGIITQYCEDHVEKNYCENCGYIKPEYEEIR